MKTINEYLLSKKNPKYLRPDFGCSVDELKKWLISLKVDEKEFIQHDGNPHIPGVGGRTIMIGPCEELDKDTHWIMIITVALSKYISRVCIKPKAQSWVVAPGRSTKEIEFEDALSISEEMVKHPEKEIHLQKFGL